MTMAPEFFKTSFHCLTGYSPMRWQQRLFERFITGDIPQAIDLPTGLGKTSVMAIWLIARALAGEDIRKSIPRRLIYVVDRRAVVDQATEEAEKLRKALEGNAEHLKGALGLNTALLPISTLRGAHVDNREWLQDPSIPAIIVGTVDMIGSRRLFEGYGISRKMRPYHAGLIGADALVVLDEAHLVPPFEHLLRAIATDPIFRPRDEKCDARVPRFRLLTLSATGRAQGSNTLLGLTDKDFQHPILAKRLNAKKSLRLQTFDRDTKLEDALAKHAWVLAGDGKQPVRVIVYSDSRKIAQKARETIEKLAKGERKQGRPAVEVDTELFVGSRRVFEREQAKERLEELGFLAGRRTERTSPAFLFATSAGEVGVDLDADHMVCDLVAWERMVQRLGRVNRRGEPDGHVANVVVLVPPKPQPDKKTQEALDKKSRNEPLAERESSRVEEHERKVQEWKNWQQPFKCLPRLGDETFDASFCAIFNLRERAKKKSELEGVLKEATSPEPLRPALTLPLVEAWSLTSLKQHPGRPAVQPWLRGWVDDPPQTAIVWRTYLPVRKSGLTPRRAEIEAFFEAAPVHTSEVLETETFRAADWILARVKKTVNERADQDSSEQGGRLCDEDVVAFVLNTDGTLRNQFRLRDLKALQDKDEFKETLGGATLIVDARLGGLKDGLLDDSAAEPPLTADDSDWLGEGIVGFRVRSIDSAASKTHDANWCERYRFACEVNEDGEPVRWLVVDKWRDDAATEDDRSEGVVQLLEEHQQRVEQRARKLAKALGFCGDLEEILALAARLHDEGKRARRWQRAFNAPQDGKIYAKTQGPIHQGLLDGYRHELGSVLRIREDQQLCKLSKEQRDLVLHLIGAHHGFARPVIPTDGCEDAPPSALDEKAAEIALRFARLQKQWGPWGLAWWEALLRAADQLASRDYATGNAGAGGA